MVFDVESVGLHGGGFAVGWVVFQFDHGTDEGVMTHEGCFVTDPEHVHGPDSGREWLAKNLPPEVLGDFLLGVESVPANPEAPYSYKRRFDTQAQLRDAFWGEWERHKDRGARLWSHWGWPVEARFLAACVDDERRADGESPRDFAGPLPLHEIETAVLLAGVDKLERLWSELPEHHPLADARHSARTLCEALAILKR